MLILRREWFGGMLVDTLGGRNEILDHQAYRRQLPLLARRQLQGEAVRCVDISADGYTLPEDYLATPADLFLELTYRCDGACLHCYADAGLHAAEDELSFAEVATLLRRAAGLGTYSVRLTGGEPTLREDLADIVELISNEGMTASINSNGLAGAAALCSLVDRGAGDLRISLDGDQQTNDGIRGRGSYHRVVEALRALAAYRPATGRPRDLTVNMVLLQSNRHCLRHLVELVAELGCKLSVGLLRPSGRARQDQMLSPGEVLAAAAEVQRLRDELRLPKAQIRCSFDVFRSDESAPGSRPYPLDGSTCALGARGIGVTPLGRVVACNYLAGMDDGRWLGEDVRRVDLLRVWHTSAVLREARRVRRSGCTDCPHHIRRCNGGCPVTALVHGGELDGHDPYCVRDAEVPSC